MASKRVNMQAGGITLNLLRVTEVKESEEIDSDMVKTFDEPVPVPSSDGGYTIDISMIEARNIDEFIKLKRIIKYLKEGTGEVSVFEIVHHKTGDFDNERHYTGVTLASNEGTVSAEDLTVRDLSFSASSLTEKVNGRVI